jgi:hypothetical protein
MGNYIADQLVKDRLVGKIRFTSTAGDDNAMQNTLLARLVLEAEAEIEFRLSPRYASPFVTTTGGAYSALPNTTKMQLETMIIFESIDRVLKTDFGRGTAVAGGEYAEENRKDLEGRIARHLEIRDGQFNHWKFPPLPMLATAETNAADDGFSGSVIVTSDNVGSYPKSRINDPGETVWSGHLDPTDVI